MTLPLGACRRQAAPSVAIRRVPTREKSHQIPSPLGPPPGSVMASLESEKPSAAYGTGYVPVPNSPEDDGDGAPTPGSHSGCEKGSRTGRSRFAWIVACCLAILYEQETFVAGG